MSSFACIHVVAPESYEVFLYSPFLLQTDTFGKSHFDTCRWNVAIYALWRMSAKYRDLRTLPGTKFWLPGTFNYSAPLPPPLLWDFSQYCLGTQYPNYTQFAALTLQVASYNRPFTNLPLPSLTLKVLNNRSLLQSLHSGGWPALYKKKMCSGWNLNICRTTGIMYRW